MKKQNTLIITALCGLFVFSQCTKKKDNTPAATTPATPSETCQLQYITNEGDSALKAFTYDAQGRVSQLNEYSYFYYSEPTKAYVPENTNSYFKFSYATDTITEESFYGANTTPNETKRYILGSNGYAEYSYYTYNNNAKVYAEPSKTYYFYDANGMLIKDSIETNNSKTINTYKIENGNTVSSIYVYEDKYYETMSFDTVTFVYSNKVNNAFVTNPSKAFLGKADKNLVSIKKNIDHDIYYTYETDSQGKVTKLSTETIFNNNNMKSAINNDPSVMKFVYDCK